MKRDDNIRDSIIAYIQGDMQGNDKDNFEQELATDPELRALTERLTKVEEEINLSFQVWGAKQEKAEIKAFFENESSGGASIFSLFSQKLGKANWILSGVAVIAIFLLFVWIDPLGSNRKNDLQFITELAIYEPPPTQLNKGGDCDTLCQIGNWLTAKDYPKIISAYSGYLKSHPQSADSTFIYLHLGHAHLENGTYEDAHLYFSRVMQTPSQPLYQENAIWLDAITFIKEEKLEQVKPLLERLVQENRPIKSRAREILEYLE